MHGAPAGPAAGACGTVSLCSTSARGPALGRLLPAEPRQCDWLLDTGASPPACWLHTGSGGEHGTGRPGPRGRAAVLRFHAALAGLRQRGAMERPRRPFLKVGWKDGCGTRRPCPLERAGSTAASSPAAAIAGRHCCCFTLGLGRVLAALGAFLQAFHRRRAGDDVGVRRGAPGSCRHLGGAGAARGRLR